MSIHNEVMPEINSDTRIMAEAERWHVRLQAPDCSVAERLEFQRWRAISEHAEAFAATQKLWQSLGRLSGRPELERLSLQIVADVRNERRRSLRGWSMAAALLLVVTCGVLLAIQQRQAPLLIYATAVHEQRAIELPDGSRVALNVSTEIDVQFDGQARRVTLRRGEALFSVAHDPSRPFSVAAADGAVVAVGTRFQVRNEVERVTVTLLEGRVNVDRNDQHELVQMLPGQQVRYTPALPGMKRDAVDVESVSSWSTGRLRFRATALAEVLAEVNRYSASQIRLGDASLAGVPVSGTFAIGDAMSVVDALQVLLDIQVTRHSDEFILSRR